MKTMLWCVVAGVGMAVMIWAYHVDRPADESASFSSGLVFVSKSGSPPPGEPIPYPSTKARVRTLSLGTFSSTVVAGISATDAERGRNLQLLLAEKVYDLSLKEAGVTETALAWGRLPQTGQNEAIAGYRALPRDQIDVAGHTLSVVGGLPRDKALFAGSYVVPREATPSSIFGAADQAVRSAVLISLTPTQLDDQAVRDQLKTDFPEEKFDTISAVLYTQRQPFLAYLFGQALWCLGGTGALISLYSVAACRVRWRIMRDPLAELSNRKRLLWGVHIAYFGLYLLAAVLIDQAPDVQDTLLAAVQSQIRSGSGALGIAGTAYATKSVPLAALVTFTVNFFLGSLALLTLPSCVIPGSGALVAAGRAFLWGILLAPTSRVLASGMLPHSGTLLLEGEGYILATFFGLLIRSDVGSSLLARYRHAFVLNLKGNLVVALVLIVAAVYEAIEVIIQMK